MISGQTNVGRARAGVAMLAALVFCAPSAAPAQSIDEDARCLMAAGVFVRSEKDPAKRQVAFAVRYYYLGRIDARASGPALRTLLEEQAKAITPANVGPTMTACARSLQSKEAALRALAGDAPK
jgi:hypothetical protein